MVTAREVRDLLDERPDLQPPEPPEERPWVEVADKSSPVHRHRW